MAAQASGPDRSDGFAVHPLFDAAAAIAPGGSLHELGITQSRRLVETVP